MQKTSPSGRTYDIDGKVLTWHPEQWEDEPPLPELRLPLRTKFGKLIDLAAESGGEQALLSNNQNIMRALELVTRSQEKMETVREMDANDAQDMFFTWLNEYNSLNGTTLGNSSASSGSAGNTEAHSSTTGEPGSTAD